MRPLLAFFISTALALTALASEAHAGIVYVSRAATGANDGTSWSNAFPELRAALPAAAPGDQVWIAAGTYTPAPPGGSVMARFTVGALEVYGGFRGTETSLGQRDWNAYPVVLSGDLNGDDGAGFGGADNSRRVVDVIGGVLDGVRIEGGAGQVPTSQAGHAASVRQGVVRHCTFRRNLSGAIDVWTGGVVTDSVFNGNASSAWAVVVMHEEEWILSLPVGPCSVVNCTFYGNSSSELGIALDVAHYAGAANDTGTLANSIFWGNLGQAIKQYAFAPSRVSGCLIEPALPPSWLYPHISGDPRFVSPATFDFRLLLDSPCIDAGNNGAIPDQATTDLAGHPRRQEILSVLNTGTGDVPLVDIGAFEVLADCDGNGTPDFMQIAAGTAADANGNTILDTCEGAGAELCLGDQSFGVACPCANQSLTGGCMNSGGAAAALSAFGQAWVSDDSLTLACSGMGANAPALYFQGDAIDAIYGPGGVAFGDGLRCAFGVVIRLGIKGSVNGASMFGAGIGSDPLISVRGALPPGGGTRYYQVWYRDAASYCTPATFNTSNGLTVVWGA